MDREEAIHNISVAMGEYEDTTRRRADYIDSLPIVNIYNDLNLLIAEKPRRKSYESPYAKFDRIKKRRK